MRPCEQGAGCAGLGSVPANLERFRESELIHCRWAMAGAAGVIAVELLGQGNWFDAPLWVSLKQQSSGVLRWAI